MKESYSNDHTRARRRPGEVDRIPHREPASQTNPLNAETYSAPARSRTGTASYGRPVRNPSTMQRASQERPVRNRVPRETPSRDARSSRNPQNAGIRQGAPRPQYRNGVPPRRRPSTRAVTTTAPSPLRALLQSWKQKGDIRAAQAEVKWQRDIVRVRGGIDKVMLGIILLLVAFGIVMVYSASYPYALTKGYDVLYYGNRQLLFAIVGILLMLLVSCLPVGIYRNGKIVLLAYAVGVLLLIAVLVMGVSEGEARRWIQVGPITIQPSEMMKFILVLALAYYVQTNQTTLQTIRTRKEKFFYNVLFPGIIIGIACGLVLLEKHLSATLIIGMLGLLVILIGGCDWKWVVPCFTAAGALLAGVFVMLNPYALKRLTTFGDEDADLLAEKFQTNQGLYAIGSGGLFGAGLGESRQKYSYIFAAHNDFIFAIVCEELGFIGAVCLIGLFIAFVWRGYLIASRAPDTLTMLLAFGITTQVGIQAMLNMCVVADIIPNTGISLPFFSYGGSSLVVLLVEMGVLLSISRHYYMTKEQLREEEARRELGMD